MLCELVEQANKSGLISNISTTFKTNLKRAQNALGLSQSSLGLLTSTKTFPPKQLIETGKLKPYKKLKTTYAHMTLEGGLQHPAEITCLCFDLTSHSVYTGGDDGLIKHWYGLTGQLLDSIKCFHTITSIAISPDNEYLIAGTSIGELRLWVREGLAKICTLSLGNAPVNSIDWHCIKNELFIIACSNVKVFIYSASEIQEKQDLAQFLCLDLLTEAISLAVNDQGYLAAGLVSGEVVVWKITKGKKRAKADYVFGLKENFRKSYFVEWSPVDPL